MAFKEPIISIYPEFCDVFVEEGAFSADEAAAVVRIAAANEVPLIPRIAGTNLGGLSLSQLSNLN